MPSELEGFQRQLIWDDFPVRGRGRSRPSGRFVIAALTSSGFRASTPHFGRVSGSRPAEFRLEDNISISIRFNRRASYRMAWLDQELPRFRVDLLHHEQGHYLITALLARDYFVDLMLLKEQTFDSVRDGNRAVRSLRVHSIAKLARIQRLYDLEIHPEQSSGQSRGPIQREWDAYFHSACTEARTPRTTAPDGTVHKIRLVDVLTAAGKNLEPPRQTGHSRHRGHARHGSH